MIHGKPLHIHFFVQIISAVVTVPNPMCALIVCDEDVSGNSNLSREQVSWFALLSRTTARPNDALV